MLPRCRTDGVPGRRRAVADARGRRDPSATSGGRRPRSSSSDLRLADPAATDEQLREALRRVGAEPWLATLEEGLETVVGDGAHRLTAMQAQQVALARVILADPAVLVLDEATADAGSAGARLLDAAAGEALLGRTALVVAHRLSQAARADRVVVLADGRVVESGPPADRAATPGCGHVTRTALRRPGPAGVYIASNCGYARATRWEQPLRQTSGSPR